MVLRKTRQAVSADGSSSIPGRRGQPSVIHMPGQGHRGVRQVLIVREEEIRRRWLAG